MIVVAHRQLRGEYGTLAPRDECEIRDDLAAELIKRGLVSLPTYQTKVSPPPETLVITPEAPARRRRSTKNKD